jgi:hypothetical protein
LDILGNPFRPWPLFPSSPSCLPTRQVRIREFARATLNNDTDINWCSQNNRSHPAKPMSGLSHRTERQTQSALEDGPGSVKSRSDEPFRRHEPDFRALLRLRVRTPTDAVKRCGSRCSLDLSPLRGSPARSLGYALPSCACFQWRTVSIDTVSPAFRGTSGYRSDQAWK